MTWLISREQALATREVQWNVSGPMLAFMYGTMAVAVGVFAYGTWQRVRIWLLGRPVIRWDHPWQRTKRVLVRAVGHASLLKERVPGLMHALLFSGFVILFAATVVVMVDHDLGIPIMRGRFYLYFQSLATNVFGLLALVGIGIAVYRRYIVRLRRLEHGQLADAVLLSALFVLLLTGFAISGLRIVVAGDPWGPWRPVGYVTGRAIASLVPELQALSRIHAWTWLLHVAVWHAFLAAIPYTKMFHVVSSTSSVFFADLEVRSTPPVLNFGAETGPGVLGIGSPLDMTWKQLLDLDACTECGRCQDVCPAWAEGKPLSPKRVILDLRDHVREQRGELLLAHAARRRGDAEAFESIASRMPPLAGGVIRPETLWACTTCRACEEACPVSIEHVPLILQLRQHLVMEQAEAPEGLVEMVRSLEARRHPFRGAATDRTAWYAQRLPHRLGG
ncbi:MAG: (Fe-S)-binding protein [Gemmatimonadetes bacterium]|nr:(Fe-S)-binding protein [Gemmatimonadota bacterium]